MNTINLVGRLARDPEGKTTTSGQYVVTICLGVDRRGKDNKKETDWIDCTAWGKTGEFLTGYTKKGERIGVTGSLQTRSWEASDGSKRKTCFVLVEKVELLEPKKAETPKPEPTTEMPMTVPTEEPKAEGGDLPFEI